MPTWIARFAVGCVLASTGTWGVGATEAKGDEIPPGRPTPVISLVIDDLGVQWTGGLRAVRLPGPVACAFLPHTSYAARLAQEAYNHNKEVIVHLPMQSEPQRTLGPGGLTLDMEEAQFVRAVQRGLDSVPYAMGVSNHMGSLLTRHPGHMRWLMQELNRRDNGWFFIDSRTTAATVARQVAVESGVLSVQRDVFLDTTPTRAAIRAQLDRLLAIARQRGTALGIGHPYAETLGVLEEVLPRLEAQGVRLVPVSRAIELQQQWRERAWQASLSH